MKAKWLLSMMLALSAVTLPAPALAAWSKGFVVDYFTDPGWKGGDKDVNCPNGDNPPVDWVKEMTTSWRTEEQAKKLLVGAAVGGVRLYDRGPKPGQNVSRDPTLLPDPKTPMVVGNIGYGFDLDHSQKTGFTSPDGKRKGLDNQYYRAVGCFKQYRGGGRGSKESRAGEDYEMTEMRAGVFTIVIVLSGEGGDPANDANMRVGMYLSKDKLGINADGAVGTDVSYRIDPDYRFMTVFEARSVKGIITPRKPLERLRLREPGSRFGFGQDLILETPQIQITMKPDGRLTADMGGYRNWRYTYVGLACAGSAAEQPGGYQFVSLWYNMQALADWKPPGVQGPNTHISMFYSMDAVPAFVITPDSHEVVKRAEVFTGKSQAAARPVEELARAQRSLGTDAGFDLAGGARSWPNKPNPDEPPPTTDPLYWAKAIQDPRGGYYAIGLASAAEPPPSYENALAGR
jgi:hypothetical protein